MFQTPLRIALSLVLLFSSIAGLAAQERPKFISTDELPLSAREVALAAGLQPLFDWLAKEAANPVRPTEATMIRQELLQDVTAASLQVDATSGQIDGEIAEIRELQNYLVARRAREINLLNLASLAVGGSLGTASASLGLVGEGHASNVTGIVGGGIITTLSVAGLRRSKGGSQALQIPSNMLADLFGRPAHENNVYPEIVRKFMNSAAPNEQQGLTRKQRLIASWVQVGRIPNPDSAKGKDKILRMTSMPSEDRKLSIGDLDDRQAMLYDFRAKLLNIKRDLAILLTNVPTPTSITHLDLSHP